MEAAASVGSFYQSLVNVFFGKMWEIFSVVESGLVFVWLI